MGNFILNIMNTWGYIGICFLIALENIFPPIPSEVILTFGGFLTTYSKLSSIGVIISATLGSLIGAIVLYYLGYYCSNYTNKIFKMNDLKKANNWFIEKGCKVILFGRFIPIVRSLVSIPAGINKMNMFLFLLYTTIGTIVWNTVLVYAGAILGDNWSTFSNIISKYSKIVLVVIIIVFFLRIYINWVNKKKIIDNK